MKITVFTGSSKRHKFLIKSLSNHQLYVVMENKKNFSFLKSKFFKNTKVEKNYFRKVFFCENKIFGNIRLTKKKYKKILQIKYKHLSLLNYKKLKPFLESDLYIVFGSSYIKNKLLKFLIKKNCINIHMGIAPYYRGSNCNFWAILDKNYHLVGSTIHRISEGIDDGAILYHSLVEQIENPIVYSMASVKSAILSLKNKIDNKSVFQIKPTNQIFKKKIRYTKNSDFNSNLLKKYPLKIKKRNFNKKLLINPIVLKKKAIYDKNFKTSYSTKFKTVDNS